MLFLYPVRFEPYFPSMSLNSSLAYCQTDSCTWILDFVMKPLEYGKYPVCINFIYPIPLSDIEI